MRITATITAKGQVTVPKVIRDRIKGKIIEFVLEDEQIRIQAVNSVAGSLSDYADGYTPLDEARQTVWGGGFVK